MPSCARPLPDGIAPMTARKQWQVVIDRVHPLLCADGGDIELVDVDDRKAFVRLTGRCASCPSSALTLHLGICHTDTPTISCGSSYCPDLRELAPARVHDVHAARHAARCADPRNQRLQKSALRLQKSDLRLQK